VGTVDRSIPGWVTCPEDYQRLMADYAYAKLTEKLNTPLSLERLAILIGRIRAFGINAPQIRVEQIIGSRIGTGLYWASPLTKLNNQLWNRCSRTYNRLHQILPELKWHKRLNAKHVQAIKSAMRLSAHRSFLNEGLPTEAQSRRRTLGALLAEIVLPKEHPQVAVPDDVVPQLLLVHPRFRSYLELIWVPWDHLD
jgi:hypothetical protein